MQFQSHGSVNLTQSETSGTLIIVDISGYTRFVQQIGTVQGVSVISRLLQALLNANCLDLVVSEIEGDAILFYRIGTPIPAEDIQWQFEVMLTAFSGEKQSIAESTPSASALSVKLVAAYGTLTSFRIHGFEKLYGETVIKAHRLLKNTVTTNTYVLISEELLTNADIQGCEAANVFRACDIYDLGPLCYRFIGYSHVPEYHLATTGSNKSWNPETVNF